jgi:hypothetical protein
VIEAYRIGIALAFQGNVAKSVEDVARYFTDLDVIIKTAQTDVKELGASMRGLTAEGRAAASAWRDAAIAIKEANRAAGGARGGRSAGGGSAGGAGGSVPLVASGAAAGGLLALSYTPRGRLPSPPLPPIPLPYTGRGALVPYSGYPVVPYWNGNTDFNTVGSPYTPYGGYTPGRPASASRALTLSPGGGGSGGGGAGFTMPPGGGNGAWHPWGAYNPPAPYFNQIPLAPFGITRQQGAAVARAVQGAAGPGGAGINGLGAALPAWAGERLLRSIWDRSADLGATETSLLQMGFSRQQVQRAESLSFHTQRNLLGTSVQGNMDIVHDLMAVVQDPSEAIKLMPAYAKMGALLRNSGHGDETSELIAAIRAGEFRGALSHRNPVTGQNEVDTAGLTHFINEMVASNILTGGQMGPSQILQFLRSSGSAGALISDEELFGRTLALQMAMGSGRAGRGLQGLEQQFTAGRMSEATANLLIQMGIIQGGGTAASNPYLKKAGMGQFIMRPNAMGADAFQEAMSTPSAFIMQRLYPKLQSELHKEFGPAYDKADDKTRLGMETAMASQIASRIPGGAYISELVRNILLIGRDTTAFHNAMGRDAYGIAIGNNPEIHMQGLVNSFTALETAAGKLATPEFQGAVDNVTKGLNALTGLASRHPEIVKVALEGLAGAVIGLGTGAALAALTVLGAPAGILAGVGGGAVVAANGLEYLDTELKKWIPGWGTPAVDMQNTQIQKHGMVLPWYWPMPAGRNQREPFPWESSGDSSAPNGVPPTSPLFGRQSMAPPPPTTTGGATGPVPVVVTNPRDLTRGVAGGIARQSNQPPSGYPGFDPRIDPTGSFYGVLGP